MEEAKEREVLLSYYQYQGYGFVSRTPRTPESRKGVQVTEEPELVDETTCNSLKYIHIRLTVRQGVTKRCRQALLTNDALVYEPKCGGRERSWGI
jgi:hypothetical protein